jgi:hypothetical protein
VPASSCQRKGMRFHDDAGTESQVITHGHDLSGHNPLRAVYTCVMTCDSTCNSTRDSVPALTGKAFSNVGVPSANAATESQVKSQFITHVDTALIPDDYICSSILNGYFLLKRCVHTFLAPNK